MAYAASRSVISPGGQYHSQSLVRYLRVAAFFTPHASFARCSDSPDLAHSCLTHCFAGIGPSGPVMVKVRW